MLNLEKAVANYTAAIEIDNNSSEAHNNLANLFNSMDNSEAEYHYKKTIELVPSEIYPRLNIANYFIKNGKFNESMKHLNELIDMGLESKEVFNSLGVTYKGLEDNKNAKNMFNKSLEIDPEFLLAQKNLESIE